MKNDVGQAVKSAARELVSARCIDGAWFINLPLVYPGGSFVTVRVDQTKDGIRVSDSGFGLPKADDVDAAKWSFKRTAKAICENTGASVSDRLIYVFSSLDDLEQAVYDVAETSWKIVADRICQKAYEDEEEAISDELSERLVHLFGREKVETANAVLLGQLDY